MTDDLKAKIQAAAAAREALAEALDEALRVAMRATGGRMSRAAVLLGVSAVTVSARLTRRPELAEGLPRLGRGRPPPTPPLEGTPEPLERARQAIDRARLVLALAEREEAQAALEATRSTLAAAHLLSMEPHTLLARLDGQPTADRDLRKRKTRSAPQPPPPPSAAAVARAERVRAALLAAQGRRPEAARALGISRQGLQWYLDHHPEMAALAAPSSPRPPLASGGSAEGETR